jgi:F-type H+-transporting ATPase subunit b
MALAAKQAETLAEETRQSLKEHVERRIKLAEERIACAEMEAVRELRNDVVEVVIAAAQNLIAAKLTPDRAKKLVSESTKALKTLLQ